MQCGAFFVVLSAIASRTCCSRLPRMHTYRPITYRPASYRRRVFLKLSAAVVGASLATAAQAQTPTAADLQQYDVELVIFSIVNSNATPEEWAAIESRLLGTPAPSPESTDTLSVPPAPPVNPPANTASVLPAEITNFPPLDAARYKLQNIAAALQRGKAYQLLGHIGWTQPGYPMEMAPKVDLANYLPPGGAITGSIALARGRYLHLSANVIYQSPQGQRFVLREQRRIQRSADKHYLDHPQFGVIAVITPRN
jgi:hypothetical protein